MKVIIGGTFDYLHKGHKKLIDKAIEIAGKDGLIFIGLTKNKITKKKKTSKFKDRQKKLKEYLTEKNFLINSIIIPIADKYGPSIEDDFDAIVVSPETFKTAQEINKIRTEKAKKSLIIIKIPFILADDGKPISSTRIYNGKIDENGRILKDD